MVAMGVLTLLPVPASALCTRPVHRSQMNTPGPAMRALTCFWSCPQNEQDGRSPRWHGVCASAGFPGRFHNLVHALVAQAEGLGDLAERRACELEPPHCSVELGARDVRRLVGVDDAGFGCFGLTQQAAIEWHPSTVPRHKTITTSAAAAVSCYMRASSSRSRVVGPSPWGNDPGGLLALSTYVRWPVSVFHRVCYSAGYSPTR